MIATDVLKMIQDNEVKFVDLRFTDTRGKEQHVTVPAHAFDADKLEDGHAFDGSSIAGWKGIQASDMLLMPDPETAHMDSFMDEATLIITCDVVEPADGKGYDASNVGKPLYGITPHRSGLGLVFDTAGALGGDLKGDGFMVSWGAAAGSLADQGRDLLHLKLTKKGDTYEASMTQLVTGFDHPIDAALVGKMLYVLDWSGKGTIWEVTLP